MKKYDEMARDVLDRIGEYEAERKLKRIRTAKIAAAVTPVCTAAVVGGGIWLSGAFMYADKPAPADSGIISESVTVTESSNAPSESSAAAVTEKTTKHEEQGTAEGTSTEEVTSAETEETAPSESAVQTETAARQTTAAAATTAAPRTTTPPRTTTSPQTTASAKTTSAVTASTSSGNGSMLREGDEPPQYRTVIQSYPVSASVDMYAHTEGTFAIAYPVTMAMNEYGDDADYRVCVELFKGGNGGTVYDYASLVAEMKRLYSLGYTAGVESYTNGGSTTYFLWIQATREQVRSFQPSSEYGYILMFPYSNQGTSETVAFNGINY